MTDQSVGDQAVTDIGAGEDGAADQIGALIDSDVRLVVEEAGCPRQVKPASGSRSATSPCSMLHGQSLHIGLDQARIDQRAGLHQQALRFELTVQLGKNT